MKMAILKASLLATAAFTSLSFVAAAQDEAVDAQAEEAATRTLGTVTVTAQKRAQNLQDVPISINAYTGDTLEDLGISETSQLGELIPGLEISTSNGEGSQTLIFLRGAGLSDFNTNNASPVGIYTDEVYVSSPALTAFQFFDTERVEVLKGPQGTLYGRNTTGGAIKFIANKPSDEFELDATASYGRFDTTTLDAAVSGPISDTVRARLALAKRDSDGFGTNLVDGSSTNGTDSFAYRGFIEADLSDDFSILANIHGANVDSQGAAFRPVGTTLDGVTPCSNEMILAGGCVDVLGYAAPADEYDGNYNPIQDIDLDSIGGYIQADWDIGNVTLTSITAYDDLERLLPEESDGSPLQLFSAEFGVESQTFSQELRASGGSDNVNWLAGLFYLTEDLDQDQTVDLFRELRAFTGGLSDPEGTVTGAPILFARVNNSQEIESTALFGQADFALTEKLTLTLGARYTDETREFSARGQLEDEIAFGAPIVLYDQKNLETSSDAFSWRVAADYQATDDALLYGSIARGFKSGGFNGGFLSLDPAEALIQLQPFDPEFLTAYEVGIKSDWLDNRLRLNAAIFYNDFSDLQVFTLVNTANLPLNILDNASGGEVVGLEFDITALPTDNLTLGLSGTFQDSELTNFVSNGGADFSGNSIANTPETSITGLARYDHDLGSIGALSFQGSAAYKSEVFFSTENNPVIAQDGYTLVNLRAQFTPDAGRWHAAVFVENATDEFYVNNVVDLSDFGFLQQILSPPQTYGIEIGVSF